MPMAASDSSQRAVTLISAIATVCADIRPGDDPGALTIFLLGTTPLKDYTMNWIILITAGLFEIVWAIGLKYTEGFSRLWPSVLTLLAMAVSVGLLSYAMKSLPVGTAYAIWVGVGAVGTAILGILLFGESASMARLISLGLIIAGIIGLKLAAAE